MTIEELIQKLKTYPPDIEVLIDNKPSRSISYLGEDTLNISSNTYVNVKNYLEK